MFSNFQKIRITNFVTSKYHSFYGVVGKGYQVSQNIKAEGTKYRFNYNVKSGCFFPTLKILAMCFILGDFLSYVLTFFFSL